jgi:hypothetical protein
MDAIEKVKPFTKSQVALFRKVVAHVEEDLRRLNMSEWGTHYSEKALLDDFSGDKEAMRKEWPACNTKACFAGWAVVLNKPVRQRKAFLARYSFWSKAAKDGQKALGLTEEEAEELFYLGNGYDSESDLKLIKERLNQIFADRGMAERF